MFAGSVGSPYGTPASIVAGEVDDLVVAVARHDAAGT